MTPCPARQAASSLVSLSPRCMRPKAPPAVRLLIPRGYLHQGSETHQQQLLDGGGLSYRPVRLRPIAPFPVKEQKPFAVNEDPRRLDAMYLRLLRGDLGLSEEVKWQAVTHKSFDHGWQAFNEKLAFFGKRVVLVHASLHHLNTRPASFPAPKTDSTPAPTPIAADPEVLRPFKHPDYRYLTYINPRNVKATLDPRKLSGLANMVGMQGVMRWKPAHSDDLLRSGESQVAVDCLYAVVGAVALQKGGDVAGRLVRERILNVVTPDS